MRFIIRINEYPPGPVALPISQQCWVVFMPSDQVVINGDETHLCLGCVIVVSCCLCIVYSPGAV